jgi:hypothetical protein
MVFQQFFMYVYMYVCVCIHVRMCVYVRGVIKTTVNAAAEYDATEKQGSSIREAARRTLVTVCDKFQLVRCSQSDVSYG